MFSVNFWGSNPAEDNADCWTGLDFETYAEAKAFYDNPWESKDSLVNVQYFGKSTAYIELDGPNHYLCRKNPLYKPSKREVIRLDHDYSYESNMPWGYGEENR